MPNMKKQRMDGPKGCAIKRLLAEGNTPGEIARRLGVAKTTVQRLAEAEPPPTHIRCRGCGGKVKAPCRKCGLEPP